VGISFLRRYREPEGVNQPPLVGFGRSTNEDYHGYPAVEFLFVGGPFGTPASGQSPVHRKVFICSPKGTADEEPCARKILTTLAPRAYRRSLTASDVQTLMSFYKEGRDGQTFSAGIEQGIERILSAPSFLFRIEEVPSKAVAGTVYPLNDVDL